MLLPAFLHMNSRLAIFFAFETLNFGIHVVGISDAFCRQKLDFGIVRNIWGFAHREDQQHLMSATSNSKRLSKKHSKEQRQSNRHPRSNNIVINNTKHSAANGNNDIEVSWGNKATETREPPQSLRQPVIRLSEQIQLKRRVNHSQFSVSFSALQTTHNDGELNGRRGHRISLSGGSPDLKLSYDQVLQILENTKVTDEYSAVKEELECMQTEIKALEKDRILLQQHRYDASQHRQQILAFNSSSSQYVKEWDLHKLLQEESSKFLSPEDKSRLKRKRGTSLTLYFQSYKAKEVFLDRFGSDVATATPDKRNACGDTITVDGVAYDLQNLTLMSNTNVFKTGFFFNEDSGKSRLWGRLPQRLYTRMKRAGTRYSISDLVYLSTGPHGSYYGEFRSGICWWGSAVQDTDFHETLKQWDVYRVVFGQIQTITEKNNRPRVLSSWIILGRDGRIAWKNIPSRLDKLLKSRMANEAAPAEISLGPGESYFVRFLDGSIDYCLPAEIAEVCDRIERQGGQITNITLHPDISHDFVIRHTQESRQL